MKLAITGTPGTGKTTATAQLDDDVVHLNEVIESESLYTKTDDERDSHIADFEAIEAWLDEHSPTIVESHLAHHFAADCVVVLRCAPEALVERLKERDESRASRAENAEAEALDVILSETVERHGPASVYEIETTDTSPSEVATEIERVLSGDREPGVGTVDYTSYL
ncbi:adenylate kinase family protein [Halocatena halophila]|uniref:adenylate kinase family protein n=1 Tax=Halocatena halophila TaxID=2814576 RepID=UPI002ED3582C